MGEALVLDSEALSALANVRERGAHSLRARAVLGLARAEKMRVVIPSPVLSEVCRGLARDAAVLRLLTGHGMRVVALDATISRRAGALLERAKLGSAHAIDAFVVATALQFESATVATGDPKDLRRLAASFPQVRLFAL